MAWLFSKKLMDSASLPCSQELVEESSEESSLDGAQCALWNGTHTPRASWLPGKMTDACRLSRSGMTFKPLTDDLGEAVLMSFLEDFPAKTSAQLEKEPALTESDQVCGDTWQESSVKFDLNTSSWRTHQCLWDEDLPESSVTLPKWGMMQNGVLWERITLPPLTSGTESGLSLGTPTACMSIRSEEFAKGREPNPAEFAKMWPTPQAHKNTQSGELVNKDGTPWDGVSKPHSKTTGRQVTSCLADKVAMWPTPRVGGEEGYETASKRKGHKAAIKHNLTAAVQHRENWPTPVASMHKGSSPASLTRKSGKSRENDRLDHAVMASNGGQLNPTWVEWLMGWPIEWTDLKPSGTGRFQQWLNSHGES